MACADDTSLSATGTEIELSRFKRKGLGIEDDNPLSEVKGVAQVGEHAIDKGPKIVARFQGLDPPDEGVGKLIDVGILSGSSIFGLEGQG